ncbi:hypothetical protein V1264_009103 [Littorina saxatilis]|uniref:Transposase Tc1-like domain-containing protein n=1 Tax=Littorina saxatilis TaxID=31220 RepID=A0AAN9AR78_9CAEN
MPPRRKLSDLDRGREIGWLQDGVAAMQVAQRLAVAPSVIIRLKQRFHATGRVQERQLRSGRPRVTTQREDRFIQRQAMQHRMATANNIRQRLQASTYTVVRGQTIRNRLHNFGLRARRPVRGTTLTANHRAARRAWCTQHVRWQRQQWAQVLFTDESRFCLEPADGRIRVWRRREERFAEGAVLEQQRFGGGSVMVWGGISTRLRTPLYHVVGNLTGVRYQNEILQPLVVPALQAIGPRAILQDDNAPPHRSVHSCKHLHPAGQGQQDAVASQQPGPEPHRAHVGRTLPSGTATSPSVSCQSGSTAAMAPAGVEWSSQSIHMQPDPLHAPSMC